jgi:hypothetical protein
MDVEFKNLCYTVSPRRWSRNGTYVTDTLHVTQTEQAGSSGSALDFYQRSAWFISRPRHQISGYFPNTIQKRGRYTNPLIGVLVVIRTR